MRRFLVILTLVVLPGEVLAQSLAVDRSIRPISRPGEAPVVQVQAQVGTRSARGFKRWVGQFRKRALAQGIRGDVFDRAFRGVSYNASIVEKDRNQSEFTKQIWD